MSRDTSNDNLLEQVLASPRRAVLLTGPGGSGKTSAAVTMYRRFAGPAPQARCLLLVPNGQCVRRLRRSLLSQSPGQVLMGQRIMTFADLGRRILRACGKPSNTLGLHVVHLLLRSVVDELCRQGRLAALAAVADTPGLIVALDRAIAELKRAAVDPRDLEAALGAQREVAAKTRDLLAVYSLYQRRLQEMHAYDVEGQVWEARNLWAEALQQGRTLPGLEGIEAAAVDGFTDFTPTQLGMLGLASQALHPMLITLPYDTDGRHRLWRWTGRALDCIRKQFAGNLSEIAMESRLGSGMGISPMRSTGVWPVERSQQQGLNPQARRDNHGPNTPATLAGIADDLFRPDLAPASPPAGLTFIAASGMEAEVLAVAARVKRMLLAGHSTGEIAVVARNLDAYRPCIERVFRQCQIPVRSAPQALTDVPVVRYLLDVAALGPQFKFPHVLRVIKNSYFRPQALGSYSAATAATAEMMIRHGNVLGGRPAYEQAAARLAAKAAAPVAAGDDDEEESAPQALRLGPIDCSAEDIRQAGQMLGRLFDLAAKATDMPAGNGEPQALAADAAAAPAVQPARPSEGLGELIEDLQLFAAAAEAGDGETIARDMAALQALQAALTEAGPMARDLPSLRSALGSLSAPGARQESLVELLDVLDARPLRFDHVLVVGVNEGDFPQRLAEGSVISEGDRVAWAASGLAIDSRSDLTAREMLLFYLTCSRANQSLTVSYLESDTEGKPGAASTFLLPMLERFGGVEALAAAGALERIPQGQFTPPPESIARPGDCLSAAVVSLFDGGHPPASTLESGTGGGANQIAASGALAWIAQNRRQVLDPLSATIFARHRRWRQGACDRFDGRLGDARLIEFLGRQFGPQTAFSATQLNTYGQCPWQFFAKYVLALDPLQEPQRRLEPVARGIFCHSVLFTVMTRLRGECGSEAPGGPVALSAIPAEHLKEALDQAIDAHAQAVWAQTPPYPALWEIQLDQMRRQLHDYLLAQREEGRLDARSLHYELAFGLANGRPDSCDPASRPEPVELQTPAGPLRLAGKIDRVDRVVADGAEGLFVVDYKTGALPKTEDILQGRSVQLPLYALAAEQLLGGSSLGGAFHRIGPRTAKTQQWFAALSTRGGTLSVNEQYPQDLQSVLDKAGQFVQGIRQGRFDLLPSHDCPSHCPYRRICHFSEVRSEVKRPDAREATA